MIIVFILLSKMAKCKLITLGKINKKIFLILIGGIIYTGLLFIEHESKFFGDREEEEGDEKK